MRDVKKQPITLGGILFNSKEQIKKVCKESILRTKLPSKYQKEDVQFWLDFVTNSDKQYHIYCLNTFIKKYGVSIVKGEYRDNSYGILFILGNKKELPIGVKSVLAPPNPNTTAKEFGRYIIKSDIQKFKEQEIEKLPNKKLLCPITKKIVQIADYNDYNCHVDHFFPDFNTIFKDFTEKERINWDLIEYSFEYEIRKNRLERTKEFIKEPNDWIHLAF